MQRSEYVCASRAGKESRIICLYTLPAPSLCTDTLYPCTLGYFIHKVDAQHQEECTQLLKKEEFFCVFRIFAFESLLCIPDLTAGPTLQEITQTFSPWKESIVFNSEKLMMLFTKHTLVCYSKHYLSSFAPPKKH